MCKTQKAILAMAKKHDKKKIAIALEHVKVIGNLKTDEGDYYEGIIGLEDVHIHCYDSEKTMDLKCINIPSHAVEAFSFDVECECK